MDTGISARSGLPGVPSVPQVRRGDAPVLHQTRAASSEALLGRRLHQQAGERAHVRRAVGWSA